MFRNGTPYAARGRWYDGNLVRWHDNALRPIGGWTRRQNANVNVPPIVSNPTTETVRDMLAYVTNAGNSQAIFASNSKLYLLTASNVLSTITVTGFTAGSNQPSQLFGYGIGPYGRGTYGTRRNTTAAMPIPVQRWTMDTWGENVLAAGVNNGPIFQITPAGVATALTNAPTKVASVTTTDQRIVMALQNDATDIRKVVWSDRENNNIWAPAVNNFAGSQKLQGSGFLLGSYKILNQVLILSETDAHVARYIGAPFVFGFERIGDNCAPVHAKAVASTDRFVVWLGARNFWVYDGTLRQLPCDVMDHIASTISPANFSKIHTQTVAEFSEIWWFYQSKSGTEVDSYVVFDYVENHWSAGRLSRTAGSDVGAYPSPVMVSPDGIIWDHEQTAVRVDGEAYAITGPLELQNGERNMAIRYVFPDTESFGSVELSFTTKQMPTAPEIAHGPFAYTNPIPTTGVLGREIRMEVRGLTSQWEVGTMRFDVQQIGGGMR